MEREKDSLEESEQLAASMTADYEVTETQLKEKEYGSRNRKIIVLYFFIGLMINTGNHIINTSAQDLAKRFNKKDLMGSFLLCLCFFAAFVRVFNNKYLLQFKHLNKALVVSLCWASGFTLFSFALNMEDMAVGFYLSLFCTVIYGANLAVATVTVIGFMKTFPPGVLVGYSSGSGLAGMTGAGIVMLARRLGVPFSAVIDR